AAEEAVRDAAPRQPAIVGLPYAAASRAVIEDERLRTDAGDRGRPSAAAEAERAVRKPLVEFRRDRRRRGAPLRAEIGCGQTGHRQQAGNGAGTETGQVHRTSSLKSGAFYSRRAGVGRAAPPSI